MLVLSGDVDRALTISVVKGFVNSAKKGSGSGRDCDRKPRSQGSKRWKRDQGEVCRLITSPSAVEQDEARKSLRGEK